MKKWKAEDEQYLLYSIVSTGNLAQAATKSLELQLEWLV